MARTHRPWRLVTGLPKVLVGSFATSAIALATDTIWLFADMMGPWRMSVAMILSIVAIILWLILVHELWDARSRRRNAIDRCCTTPRLLHGTEFRSAMPDAAPRAKTCERNAQPSNASESPTSGSIPNKGYTGRNRHRPGLREALAVCREGDTLVVTKLDRLGRSAVDLRAIADELEAQGTRLSVGGFRPRPDRSHRQVVFFGMWSLMAEFESDLIRPAHAKKAGRLKGKQPKLSALQGKRLLTDYESGEPHRRPVLPDQWPLAFRDVRNPAACAGRVLERVSRG